MREVVFSLSGVAGDCSHEVLRMEGGAFGVDVCLEPREEGGGVSFGEGSGDGAVFQGRSEELGGIEVTEGVSGEVAKASHRPVDVL